MSSAATTAIFDLAAAQHGAIETSQVDDLGVTRRWLDNLVRRCVMRRAAAGVYVVAGSVTSWEQQLTIGLLALGKESWVSHEAAAQLLGLDRSKTERVEFMVLRGAKGRRLPFIVHSTHALPLIDRVTVNGLRCTSATRTIIDLARARISQLRLEAAIDSAVRLGWSAPSAIAARLDAMRGRGRWGAPLLDRLLVDSGGHTMLEREFLKLVRNAGLPRPRTQVIHRGGGRTIARVDFLFDPYDVVVEVTGQLGHSAPADRDRDAQRRDELQDLGRKVYEYTWNHVKKQPGYVERTLTQRLHRAGWRR